MNKYAIYQKGFDYDFFEETYSYNFSDDVIEVFDSEDEAIEKIYQLESYSNPMESHKGFLSLTDEEKQDVLIFLKSKGIDINFTLDKFYDVMDKLNIRDLPKQDYLTLLEKLECNEYYISTFRPQSSNVMHIEDLGYVNETPHEYSEILFECNDFKELEEKLMDHYLCTEFDFYQADVTENDLASSEFNEILKKLVNDDDIEIIIKNNDLRVNLAKKFDSEEYQDNYQEESNARKKQLVVMKAFNDIIEKPSFTIHKANQDDLLVIKKRFELLDRFKSSDFRKANKVELEIPEKWLKNFVL